MSLSQNDVQMSWVIFEVRSKLLNVFGVINGMLLRHLDLKLMQIHQAALESMLTRQLGRYILY